MVDLFRYVEHDFAIPTRTDAIDVANQSDFQAGLVAASDADQGSQRVRERALRFLSDTISSPIDDPAAFAPQLTELPSALAELTAVNVTTVRHTVKQLFGRTVKQLVASVDFRADKELLENTILAVKLVTGFDRIATTRLVLQLRAVALLQDLAAGTLAELTAAEVARLLERPLRMPPDLLPTATRPPTHAAEDLVEPDESERGGLQDVQHERDQLQSSYDALLAIPPSRLELISSESDTRLQDRPADGEPRERTSGGVDSSSSVAEAPTILCVGAAGLESLGAERRRMLSSLPVDVERAPVTEVVDAVKRRLSDLNAELLPLEVRGPARVYRVGVHLFTEDPAPVVALSAPSPTPASGPTPTPAPDFSYAVTRPVGVGNLQVVRQELVGYRAGDISHIENVLEGELLRRSTRREDVNEVTVTEETQTTQVEERDQQSTDRNELASESQKEAGRQSTTSAGAMTSTDYGKLVENSKTNFAQTVTSKAVESLTQQVRQQRVQRERKTYLEDAVHELDNQKGADKVRGIYQWVDKLYSVRVLNYGKRLMYDVVVPEPAAFLMQSLKSATQPESFQLTKPTEPWLKPYDLNAANYAYYAALYGVTGSVSPPADEYSQTVAKAEPIDVQKELNTYGKQVHGAYLGAFILRVPEGYKAVSAYIQRVNVDFLTAPGRYLEFFVGDTHYCRFGPSDINALNTSFLMDGETGDLPVTFRSFAQVTQFAYAVGITCQRTDRAYEQWQLETHAAIVSGYQRQLADYQDKLGRYVAATRSQLALAANYAHDASVERDELKKAFIFLLFGEHPGAHLPTPTPAPVPPSALPPDPFAVRDWGAVVAFFERAFDWENLMYTFYPYFWGRPERWEELILTQDVDPQFEAFLKAGAARVVVPVRPGFEAALAHYQETGDIWMGEEIPDMFGDHYVSIIAEIKAANFAPGDEVCVQQWEVTLPTTLVLLKDDAKLPTWTPTACNPPPGP